MAWENRYIGYLDDASEDSGGRGLFSTVFGLAGVAAAGFLGGRLLVRSGALRYLNDVIAPRLTAFGRSIARAEASRLPGQPLARALSEAFEFEARTPSPPLFISRVLEQRSALLDLLERSPRMELVASEAGRLFGPGVAAELRHLFQSAGPIYFQEVLEHEFVRAVSRFLSPAQARQVFGLLKRYRGFRFRASELPGKIDELIAEELARTNRPGIFHRLLGLRPATVGEALEKGLLSGSRELTSLLERFPHLRGAAADPSVFVTAAGELLDLRRLSQMWGSFLDWVGRTLPGRVAHLEEIRASRNAPFLYVVPRGRIQPFVTGTAEPLQESLLVVGRRAVFLYRPSEVLADDVALALNTGTLARITRHMLGLEPEPERTAPSIIGWLADRLRVRRLLDLGNQDRSSLLDSLISRFTKFADPRWYGNVFARAFSGEIDVESISRFFRQHTRGFSEPVLRVLDELLPESLRGIRLHSAGDVLEALERLAPYSDELRSLLQASRMGQEIEFERARRLVSHELLRQTHVDLVKELMDRAVLENRITKLQAREALELVNAHIFEMAREISGIPGAGDLARAYLQQLFTGQGQGALRFQREVAEMVRRYAGGWKKGLVTVPPGVDAGRYLVIRRTRRLSSAFEAVRAQNDYTKLLGFFKQFTAGRRNLEDVTAVTLIPYHLLERMNRALAESGFALGPRSLGSVGDIAFGFLFKRALPAYMLWQGLSYLSFEVGEFTGLTAEQRYYRTRARFALDLASIQDAMGLTDLRKAMYRTLPGIEVLGDVPFLGVPFREPRTREELGEWLRYGEEPVRQGRYWLLSSSPWRGGRIQYWKPSWYRLGMSQWEFTGTLYGSPEEYWAHRWFPTPRYPFSPLTFLLDPYWLERRHFHDRPYPVTGPLVSEEVVFGPFINATLGRIIKPPRRMHEEELRRANESVRERAGLRRVLERSRYYVVQTGEDLMVAAPVYPAAGEPVGGYVVRAGRGGLFVPGVPGGVAAGLPGAMGLATQSNAAVRSAAAHRRLLVGWPSASGLVEIRSGVIPSEQGEPQEYDLMFQLGQAGRNIRNVLGIYGWLIDVAGAEMRPQLVEASAGRMYSLERAWRDMALGGTSLQLVPGYAELAEIARRFVTRRPAAIGSWNPIPNQMPPWIPGANYFQNFHLGDSFASIPIGEVRLPGEAYRAAHPLYPDVDSELGFFTRFAILSDVAPWSDEWRIYSRIVSCRREELPEYLQRRVTRIRRQVALRKQHYDLHPYRFLGQKTRSIRGTVAGFVDASTFLIEEMPDVPVRLAGVRLTAEHPISEYLRVGQEVELVVDADLKRARDTLRTLRATVFVDGRNLNLELLRSGVVREKETDWSAAGVLARFTPLEREIGGLWERLAHADIPMLHRKFLPVDSPLEYYERRLVYGKEFATWEHPWSDYLQPTIEAYSQKPLLVAAAFGALTGWAIGRTMLGGGLNTKYAALAGAIAGATASLLRLGHDLLTGERWVPERVRRRWEIETYFDILEYLKYRGIYEYAARRAARLEGTDVDRLYREAEELYERKRHAVNLVMEQKRRAMMAGDKEAVRRMNARLRVIESMPRVLGVVGPWGRAAIAARQRYESTLYGVNVYNTRDVVRALPASSRQFYKHFVEESDPERRRRILSVVPPLERRIYQAAWGMRVDELPSLEEYFREHRLPPPEWPGWRPDVDLELVKLKVVKSEGLDLHDYNFFPGDELEARFAPDIVEPFKPYHYVGGLRRAIQAVLQGSGLTGISIESVPLADPRIQVDFDLVLDRKDEVTDYIESGSWAS